MATNDKDCIRIHAVWDAEAGVWVATSDNLPGLVTEADTAERLLEKIKVMIPELIELNGDHQSDGFPLCLLMERNEYIAA